MSQTPIIARRFSVAAKTYDRYATLQRAVARRLIQGLDPHAQPSCILEIGCGWGGFAMEAVSRTGCRVTGITISDQQYQMATERIRQAGLQDRITILLKDYRQITGLFDKIVSIEML